MIDLSTGSERCIAGERWLRDGMSRSRSIDKSIARYIALPCSDLIQIDWKSVLSDFSFTLQIVKQCIRNCKVQAISPLKRI